MKELTNLMMIFRKELIMRPPYFMPPMPIVPRFPMYAPYMMRTPMFNPMQMGNPMPIPPQFSGAPVAAGAPRLEGFLSGANSLFTNAQKFTPYIQQAAPMFKNLPALWRLYRGFKNTSDPLESSTIVAPIERPQRRARNTGQWQEESVNMTPKPSLPMIFQPPFH